MESARKTFVLPQAFRAHGLNLALLLGANLLLLAVFHLDPTPVGLARWDPKIDEIASLAAPSSNFYPFGAALLCLPFRQAGLDLGLAVFFYMNVGVILYVLICDRLERNFYRNAAKLALLLNPYFFWLMKGSQDVVLQFAVLSLAFHFLLARRPAAYAALALLATLVRSTDIFVFSGITLFMLVSERRAIWLLFPALYLCVMAFNFAHYGSVSPSLNGGYNMYLGQHPLYVVGHPRFDIDVFYEKNGFNVPPPVASLPRTADIERKRDAIYRGLAMQYIRDDPARFVYSSAMKVVNWLFNFEKVPNLSGSFFIGRDGKSVVVERQQHNLDLPNTTYIAYKILYNFLFAIALFSVTANPRRALRARLLPLVFPVFLTLPVVVLAFPDTRFKIVYEILAVPMILSFAGDIIARERSADAGRPAAG